MTPEQLKEQFIGWQCRIRQYAVRKDEGRPSPGMQPVLEVRGQGVGPLNVQIVKTDSEQITREFRFMMHKTQDPRDRYTNIIKMLSEYYYQIPAEFDEELTAVYSTGSELADQLVEAGRCMLRFDQGNQVYSLNCQTRLIPRDDAKYQATYWHNHLFNPAMPGVVKIVGLTPDWEDSEYKSGNEL
jgi:hypothetical protein